MEISVRDNESVSDMIKKSVAATVRNEEWKYTNVQFLSRDTYAVHQRVPYQGNLFTFSAEAATTVSNGADPFLVLGRSLSEGISTAIIGKNTAVEQPIELNVVADCQTENVAQSNRFRVVVEEGASVTVVERHSVNGSNVFLDLFEIEFDVHENASVEYIKIFDSPGSIRHLGHTTATLARESRFTSFAVCIDGAFIRNNLRISFKGEGANAYLYGVSVLTESQFADNHTVVDHEIPRCHSEELYKGVYDGKSVGVFNGKIYVRPDAQKTTAYQSCKSILVSKSAQVNAKPQLEIWADDVKCSHGATTGKIDEEALFYLRTRGLTYDDARALITYAHAAEVVEHISSALIRNSIERRIAQKLGTIPLTL
ncbi:MAG: Fe-S cluster assembly protein SufD [Ignavibacteria bacterium]|nr:Fe-S cluster assembly protein SufD [Ignavibacteria bacterium]